MPTRRYKRDWLRERASNPTGAQIWASNGALILAALLLGAAVELFARLFGH